MGPASVLSLLVAAVVLLSGAVNAWLWRARRGEPAHLWLAVAAAGVAAICVGDAAIYEGASRAEVAPWQRVQFAASAPLIVGFLRFSFRFLRVERPLLDRAGIAIGAGGALLALCTPLVVGETVRAHAVPWLHLRYVQAEVAPLGRALFVLYGGLFAAVIRLYWGNLARVDDHGPAVLGAICVWAVSAVNDMGVALGTYDGPRLIGVGYTAFLWAFSGILLRRFVRSSEELERWAETLQRLVDERTAELRDRELELADGERIATLSTLAASCAHEINNPAAYVTSSLNRLEEIWKREGRPEDDEFVEILSECRDGVERIRATVGDLLSLAQRSDGRREHLDLTRLAADALAMARREARYRVALVTELRPVPLVLGDRRLLAQVVLHLTVRAIQSAAAGASARPRVSLETSFDDGSVWLVVRDNGRPIPEALRPHVFDPLFAGGATGLGLAVAHRIVTSHLGRIDLESGAEGTTVVVELPVASRTGSSTAT